MEARSQIARHGCYVHQRNTFTYTLTSTVDASPIPDTRVWVTFYLDAGTVYIWRQKAGWNVTNPDQEEIS